MQWIITFSAEDPFIGCDNHTERCSVSPAQLFCAVVPSLPNPFVQLYPVLVLCPIPFYSVPCTCTLSNPFVQLYPVFVLCPIPFYSCTLYLYSVQSFCTVVPRTYTLLNDFLQLYPVLILCSPTFVKMYAAVSPHPFVCSLVALLELAIG